MKDADEFVCLLFERRNVCGWADRCFLQQFEPEQALIGLFDDSARFVNEICVGLRAADGAIIGCH